MTLSEFVEKADKADCKLSMCNTIVLHDGVFHADDVFAYCLVAYMSGKMPMLIRTRKEVPDHINPETTVVADVGNGHYDHHIETKVSKYNSHHVRAAVGLLWEKAREELKEKFDPVLLDKFDEEFIYPIEDTDNYGPRNYPNQLSGVISSFNAKPGTPAAVSDSQFMMVVNIASAIFSRQIMNLIDENIEIKEIRELKPDGQLLVVPDKGVNTPLAKRVHPGISMVVFKKDDGTYGLTSLNSDIWKIPQIELLPEEVKGDCLFVHRTGFFAVFGTMPSAIKVAKMLIDGANEKVGRM